MENNALEGSLLLLERCAKLLKASNPLRRQALANAQRIRKRNGERKREFCHVKFLSSKN